MASNVTPPPATPSQDGGVSINPEVLQELLADLNDGKPSVAKVRDAVVKLLNALLV